MKPRNLYVNNLFNAIKNDNLSLDERNHRAKKSIEAIVATKLVYEKFKQDNPGLKIDQENDVSVDAIDEHGATPLILAAQDGHAAVVETLLEAKADPNKGNEKNGITPLMPASQEGHISTVKVLLAAKADPGRVDDEGDTSLILASDRGHTAIVEMLLAAKADSNQVNEKIGTTPLLQASLVGHTSTAEALLKAKADPNKAHGAGATPLTLVAKKGHTSTAEALLKAKADPNKANEKTGETPLIWTAKEGHAEIATILLDMKADIDLLDNDGKSALDYSIENNNIVMVYLLLNSNAEINNFQGLRNFLLSQNQSDPYVIECFRVINKYEANQIEKLRSLDNAYGTYFSYFLQETTLPKNVTSLVLAYDGRFFQPQKLSPINILKPHTINPHLEELKKDILEKTKSTPGLFSANTIQEIDKALALGKSSEMQDTPFSTRMTGMKRKRSD